VTFASFNLLSSLGSSPRWDRAIYLISVTVACALAAWTTGYFVFDDEEGLGYEEWTPLVMANVLMVYLGAVGIYFVMNLGREYVPSLLAHLRGFVLTPPPTPPTPLPGTSGCTQKLRSTPTCMRV
jgi:hypothetical protein